MIDAVSHRNFPYRFFSLGPSNRVAVLVMDIAWIFFIVHSFHQTLRPDDFFEVLLTKQFLIKWLYGVLCF